ncbi:MAG: GTP 3',8-cyclase MoaA [Candidatus Omnitrophica bacterium]|nr:GTP 3',8-cyclase MoaA [Candidatus Omnitrophota bacterium]MCM8802246.1 GTP 3',8-cyclase MoaA [Candidatus Omnitrophota bacterium]
MKKIVDTLRVSITDKCNFNCIYCSRKFNKVDRREILSYEEIIKIVKIFGQIGIEKIKITGGEPLIRKNLSFLIKKISEINRIKEISLTTNGFYLLKKIDELIVSGVKRINISLDTLNRNKFKFITESEHFDKVIDGIKIAKDKFLTIKLNVVLMKINFDEIFDFIDFAKENGLILRFIELMPVDNNLDFWKKNFICYRDAIEKIKSKSKIFFLSHVRNTKYYLIVKDNFKIGFITSVTEPFCSYCNKIRIDAKGNLFLCLYGQPILNFKKILYELDSEEIKKILIEKINSKSFSRTYFNLPVINIIGG